MADNTKFDSVEEVAEDFISRLREGKRPSIREYAQRYPEFAEEIMETFEALAMMENLAPGSDDSFGVASQAGGAVVGGVKLESIGDYRIIREIGRGGMGVVYEAEQTSLRRHVALKVLPPQALASAKHRRRFEREARAAAKLHHTNIVPVFGVGKHDDMDYYVMQYIQGLGLDEVLDELKRMRLQPGSTDPTMTGGALQVSRRDAPVRDVSAAEVAHSLITGNFQHTMPVDSPAEEAGEDADNANQDNGSPKTQEFTVKATGKLPSDDKENPSNSSSTKTSDPALKNTSSSRLSDSFSISGSSLSLPGQDSAVTGRQLRKKMTYWQSVANIGAQVADALRYAHEQNILHRDIKPGNLLLDVNGIVWVTDFGLAKANDDQNLTQTGDILGTLRYMPPEAFAGRSGTRGDIYSLGLTLYEMLTLQPPFDERDKHKLIKQVTDGSPEPLTKVNPEIPTDLATIIHKAIERDPGHRYQSAEELADDLHRYIHDEPIRARRVSLPERFLRWSRRNKALAASLSAVAVLVTFLAIASTIAAGYFKRQEGKQRQLAATNKKLADDKETQRQQAVAAQDREAKLRKEAVQAQKREAKLKDDAVAAQKQATESAQAAEKAREEARRQFYASDSSNASYAARSVEQYARLQGYLNRWKNETNDPRDWEYYFLQTQVQLPDIDFNFTDTRGPSGYGHMMGIDWSPDGQRIVTTSSLQAVEVFDALLGEQIWRASVGGGYGSSVDWSPQGDLIAQGTKNGIIFLLQAETGEILQRIQAHAHVHRVQFSNDGKLLASCDGGEIKLWDPKTGKLIRHLKKHNAGILDIVWGPQDRQLAACARNGEVKIFDPDSGEVLQEWLHPNKIDAWAASADLGLMAFASQATNSIEIWDVEAEKVSQTLTDDRLAQIKRLAFRPDGKRLATIGGNTRTLWDIQTGRLLERAAQKNMNEVVWSHDGSMLASAGEEETVHIWPGQASTLPRLIPAADKFHWGAGGGYFVTAEGKTITVWDAYRWEKVQTLSDHHGNVTAVCLSPDERFIAAADAGKNLYLWDRETGEKLKHISRIAGPLAKIAFSPDQKWLSAAQQNNRDFHIWDTEKWQKFTIRNINENWHRWSPDSRYLLGSAQNFNYSGTNGTYGVWDSKTKKWRNLGSYMSGPFHAAWNPQGQQAAVVSWFYSIAILDLDKDGKPITQRGKKSISAAHGKAIHHLDWSANGRRLVSVGDEKKARVWDVDSLQQVHEIENALDARWGPYGLRLAVRTPQGIEIHDASIGAARGHWKQLLPMLARQQQLGRITNDGLRTLVATYAHHKEWKQALATIDALVKITPDDSRTGRLTADIYEQYARALEISAISGHSYIGVSVNNLTNEMRRSHDYRGDGGLLVTNVLPGGPAENAGLLKDDIVRTFNGQQLDNYNHFVALSKAATPGETATMEIFRDGNVITLPVKIGEKPNKNASPDDIAAGSGLTPQQRRDLARQYQQKACDRHLQLYTADPSHPHHRKHLLSSLKQLKAEDLEKWQRAFETDAKYIMLHATIGHDLRREQGLTAAKTGDLDAAAHHLAMAMSLSKEPTNKTSILAATVPYKGLLEKITQRLKDHAFHAELASTYDYQQQWDKALAHWQFAVKASPEDAMLRISLGRAALHSAQAQLAKDSFDKAIEFIEDKKSGYRAIAKAYHDAAQKLVSKGKPDEAAQYYQLARSHYDLIFSGESITRQDAAAMASVLLAMNRPKWTVLTPAEMKSTAESTLTKLDDSSVLVGGPAPERDLYSLTFADLPAGTKTLRLETLRHESLPKQGPGRSEKGMFYLLEFVASLKTADFSSEQVLTIQRAAATHDHTGVNTIAAAIDKNMLNNNSWFLTPGCGETNSAVFVLDSEVTTSPESVLTLSMLQRYGLGRFRISATDDLRAYDYTTALTITDPWLKLGAAFNLTGSPDQAARLYAKALDVAPDDGAKLLLLQQAAAKDEVLVALIELRPDDPQLHVGHGNLLVSQNRWGEASAAFRKAVQIDAGAIDPWIQTGFWKVGSYPLDINQSYPPEELTDPLLPVPAVAVDGKGRPADLRWQPVSPASNGKIELGTGKVCNYVQTRLWSPREQQVAFQMGDDDAMRLFVNGEMLFESKPNGGGARPKEHEIAVTLREGWNTILLKVQNVSAKGNVILTLSTDPEDLAVARLGARKYQAVKLLDAGKSDEALALLDELIKENPDSDTLYAQRALAYEKLNNWEEAIADWSKADEINPDGRVGGLYIERRINNYGRLKQYDKQLADANTLLKRIPDGAYAYSQRAMAHDALRQWDKALADHDRAIELVPSVHLAEFFIRRGRHYVKQGRWREAATQFAAAEASDVPSTTVKHWTFPRENALIHLMAGDVEGYRKAADEFLKRLGDKMNKDQARWLVYVFTMAPDMVTDANRARLLAAAALWDGDGNWKNALTACIYCRAGENEKAVELFKSDNFQGLPAIAYYKTGDMERAESRLRLRNAWIRSMQAKDPESAIPPTESWQAWALFFSIQREANRLIVEPRMAEVNKTLAAQPNNAEALTTRGRLYYDLAKDREALADFNKAIEAKPDLAEALLARARVYAHQGESEKALADFQAFLKLKPNDKQAFIARGDLYTQQKKWKQAAEDYSRVITQETKDAALIAKRANAYKQLEQWEDAVDDWSRALELKPDDVGYLNERAGARSWNLRQHEKSLSDWNRLVELDPKNPWPLMNRSGTYNALGQKDEAMADINQAVEIGNPVNLWRSLHIRGGYLAQQGQWEKATDDLDKAFALNAAEYIRYELYRDYSLLRLMAGDAKGHRAGIARLDQHLAENNNADRLRWLIFTAVAGPDTVSKENHQRLLEVVQKKLQERQSQWQLRLTASLHYRAGMYQEAADLFDQNPKGPHNISFKLLAAMAHHRLSNQEQAKKLFDNAIAWIKQQEDKAEGPAVPSGQHWRDWVIIKSLQREATALLGEKTPAPNAPADKATSKSTKKSNPDKPEDGKK